MDDCVTLGEVSVGASWAVAPGPLAEGASSSGAGDVVDSEFSLFSRHMSMR